MRLPDLLGREHAVNLVLIISLAVLATFTALSVFAFPSADDFCYAVKVQELGFFGAQRDWYLSWSGRYAANGLVSAFVLAGGLDRLYALAPVLVLLITSVAFFALVSTLAGPRYPIRVVLASSLALCVLFVAGLPDVAQTLYWVSGSFTYQLGNVSLLLLLALAAQQELSRGSSWSASVLRLAVASVLAWIAAGANEATMLCLLLLLGCGAVFSFAFRRGSAWFWTSLLLIAAAGALTSLLAPGNAARAASLAGDGMIRPPAWLAGILFVPWALLRIAYWLSNPAIWASAVLVLAATWDDARAILRCDGVFQRRWLLVPACWAGVLLVVNGLGFLVNRYPLPERAESVVYLMFLLGWYPSVIVLYHRFLPDRTPSHSPFVTRWALVLLLVGLIGAPNVFEGFKDVYRGYRYRQEMAARLELIREAQSQGDRGLEVPSISRPPRTLFATELTTDTANFRNACPARYYGLEWIRLGDRP